MFVKKPQIYTKLCSKTTIVLFLWKVRKDGDKTLETSLLGAKRTCNGNFSVIHSGLLLEKNIPVSQKNYEMNCRCV